MDGRRADNVSVIQPRSRDLPSCTYEQSCVAASRTCTLYASSKDQASGTGCSLQNRTTRRCGTDPVTARGKRHCCAGERMTLRSSDRYVAIRVGGFADGDDECCCCGMQFDPLLWSDSELRSCPGVADTASQRARLQLATHGYELFSSCSYCHIYSTERALYGTWNLQRSRTFSSVVFASTARSYGFQHLHFQMRTRPTHSMHCRAHYSLELHGLELSH